MKKAKLFVPIVIAVFIAVTVMSIWFIEQNGCATPTSASAELERQVVVDPGHGGEDGGATANGLVEKDINLNISLILADMLRVSGFDVIMTRTEDISIYDESAKSLRDKKRSDILNRLEISNQNPNAIMVSVHQNKFEQSRYSGAQVFYGKKNELSKPLAESVQQSFIDMIQPNNTRVIKPITSSVYLINNAQTPAILVECGFLSNYEEAAKLANDSYQRQVAYTIFNGILSFYEMQ